MPAHSSPQGLPFKRYLSERPFLTTLPKVTRCGPASAPAVSFVAIAIRVEYLCLSTASFPLLLSLDPQLHEGGDCIFLAHHCPLRPQHVVGTRWSVNSDHQGLQRCSFGPWLQTRIVFSERGDAYRTQKRSTCTFPSATNKVTSPPGASVSPAVK